MPKKRIILMYISEVSGHRNAAMAIEKALKILSPETEILGINAFRYTNPISEKVVNRIYMGVIKRAPKIWDYLYDNQSVARKLEHFKKMVHRFNSPKLKKLFDNFKPDVVVCTQAYPCGMVADYKKAYLSCLPLIAVLTDYVPHSYWIYDSVDYYISPAEEVSLRLTQKGVAAEKIRTLGIPFDPKFNEPVDIPKVKEKMRLDPKIPTILIMGGGQGLGPIKDIIKSLGKVKNDFQAIVITGTNKKLYNSLSNLTAGLKNDFRISGFVSNVHELMAVSELIITKPGGVTTAEALTKNIPMLIVKAIPGQEANNSAFLTKSGSALKVNEPKKIGALVEQLLTDKDKLKRMSESTKIISKPNASMDIARLILNLPQNKHA